jgi:hypothetical protein
MTQFQKEMNDSLTTEQILSTEDWIWEAVTGIGVSANGLLHIAEGRKPVQLQNMSLVGVGIGPSLASEFSL